MFPQILFLFIYNKNNSPGMADWKVIFPSIRSFYINLYPRFTFLDKKLMFPYAELNFSYKLLSAWNTPVLFFSPKPLLIS